MAPFLSRGTMEDSLSEQHYVVATIKPWNIKLYNESVQTLSGTWHLITNPADLTLENLQRIQPRYIFFPHWSQRVPLPIIEQFECVCFHETDVPYGRGGSPLQNLIVRGHTKTVITALKMVEDFDAGPVYAKKELSLHGLAEEVYLRAARTAFEMIKAIVAENPTPVAQSGEPTVFKRRKPRQSAIAPDADTLEQLFDHIRMLDAEGYPKAFIEYGRWRIEFSRPALRTSSIETTAKIRLIERSSEGN
jgi:methionyl-tRNA formyltransferase